MDQSWDRAHGPQPSVATVQVRELSWQGLHNPCPQSKDTDSHGESHVKQLVEEHLSPARLVSAGGQGLRLRGLHGVIPAAGVQPALGPWPCWPCLFDGCVRCACVSPGANPRCLVTHMSHRHSGHRRG